MGRGRLPETGTAPASARARRDPACRAAPEASGIARLLAASLVQAVGLGFVSPDRRQASPIGRVSSPRTAPRAALRPATKRCPLRALGGRSQPRTGYGAVTDAGTDRAMDAKDRRFAMQRSTLYLPSSPHGRPAAHGARDPGPGHRSGRPARRRPYARRRRDGAPRGRPRARRAVRELAVQRARGSLLLRRRQRDLAHPSRRTCSRARSTSARRRTRRGGNGEPLATRLAN